MTTTTPDPRRPYKAYVAAAAAAAAVLLSLGLSLPSWATIVLTVIAAFGGTYATPNPTRDRPRRKRR